MENFNSGSLGDQKSCVSLVCLLSDHLMENCPLFGVHIVFLKALFVEWLTGWKNTSYVSVKKMGCCWLGLGDSQQWSGVDMPVCWWKFRVLTSGGDGPGRPGAGQQRVDSVGWARAHYRDRGKWEFVEWSGVKGRVRIHARRSWGPRGHSGVMDRLVVLTAKLNVFALHFCVTLRWPHSVSVKLCNL